MLSHVQLCSLGYSADAIRHRLETGRLFVVHRGVYALGRRELGRHGEWMAAVLACGSGAALSHDSAAELFGMAKGHTGPIHVSTLAASRSRKGIEVHRRSELDATTHEGVPATTPAQTLIDISAAWPQNRLEAAIAEADKRDLIRPDRLRKAAAKAGRRGATLRRLLDQQTFRLTESELERHFLRIVNATTNLALPETQVRLGRFRVDFIWQPLLLVVETDGGRFHRTAAQQTQDRRKDQYLATQGYTVLRFTHAQIVHDPDHVARTLNAVAGY